MAKLNRKTGKQKFSVRVSKDWRINKEIYFMVIPVVVFYIMFHYVPMYGAVIAFKDFSPRAGIFGSEWVGFKHFTEFFSSFYFKRLIRNTLTINIASLIFTFPAPIILALLINELKSKSYAKIVQTVSYLPHFISMVVVCGMITNFVDGNGIINHILAWFGVEPNNLLYNKNLFLPIYILSGLWQEIGWSSIIYIAALTVIDQELYEAIEMDGGGRWQKMWNISLPGIIPTIVTLLVLRIGQIMNVGYEKIILLENGLNMETADVISSYVYREGLQNMNWSYSAAVGLFNSVINLVLLIFANYVSRKFNETALW